MRGSRLSLVLLMAAACDPDGPCTCPFTGDASPPPPPGPDHRLDCPRYRPPKDESEIPEWEPPEAA